MRKARKMEKGLRLILQGIADKNGVSLERVKQDIQEAINDAWDNPDPVIRARQRELFPNGKPSIAEFIHKMSQTAMETDDTDE